MMSEADETHLTEERYSEICSQQALARVHDLCDLTVGTVQGGHRGEPVSATNIDKTHQLWFKVSFNFYWCV